MTDPHRAVHADVSFVVLKKLVVRREFTRGEYVRLDGTRSPCLELRRNCGLGCECAAQYLTQADPSPQLAERKSLCFNSRTKQGISEVEGTAAAIKEGPDAWAYEVEANLVELRPLNDAFTRGASATSRGTEG